VTIPLRDRRLTVDDRDDFAAFDRCWISRPVEAAATPKGGILSLYLLKLYVTGTSPRAELAVANLRRICEQELHGEYELQIIDVLKHPQLAEDEKILATPTLIKQLPPPLRRVIGDLSDKDKVLLGLEVRPGVVSLDPPSTQRDAQ
jgi:circadian clock protein KaiB